MYTTHTVLLVYTGPGFRPAFLNILAQQCSASKAASVVHAATPHPTALSQHLLVIACSKATSPWESVHLEGWMFIFSSQ